MALTAREFPIDYLIEEDKVCYSSKVNCNLGSLSPCSCPVVNGDRIKMEMLQ